MARKGTRHELRCDVCGKTFSSDIEYGEHVKTHEWEETTPSPVPATERYHEGNPGVTAGVAQHEASGQFSGQPSLLHRSYMHLRKAVGKTYLTPTLQSDAFVFFGATGDLAYKQIFPSIYTLIREGRFNVPIIGVAKSGWSLDHLRARAKDSLEHCGGYDATAFQKLSDLLRYVDGDYADAGTFVSLRKQLGDAKRPLHYLAIPPSLFSQVLEQLAASGCSENASVVVEKPFGHDVQSARNLNGILHRYFPEKRIFRIDHFLGKEPVRNILYTRFANPIFEPIWDRSYISSIQMTMAESFGARSRPLL